MARIIDADILKENCRITGEFMNNFECVSLKTLGEIIDKQPTIEAGPVKHGKWKAVPNRILIGGRVATQGTAWECSACNNSSKQYLPTMKFCPNCGARMDGE